MRYSRHARNRMRHLKLTPADVEAVIAEPELSDVGAGGKVRHYGVVRDGLRIRIVLASEDSEYVVSVHERRR